MASRLKKPVNSSPREDTRDQMDCSVGEVLEFLCPGVLDADPPLSWPPDIFAMASCILHRSGAYVYIVQAWPPAITPNQTGKQPQAVEWKDFIKDRGEAWRTACTSGTPPPNEISAWWSRVVSNSGVPLSEIRDRGLLCEALLQLCAAADEACNGVGIPSGDGSPGNPFEKIANQVLVETGTLCKRVHASRARVLPKSHTPQNGLTIRSISHNLALIPGGEIEPNWYIYPRPQKDCITLLLLPWPEVVNPASFSSAFPKMGRLKNMPPKFGFFRYCHESTAMNLRRHLRETFRTASAQVGTIDAVIFPELALSAADYDGVSDYVLGQGAFLVSGIAGPPARGSRPGNNYLAVDFPFPGGLRARLRQEKHHRWRLDKSQIKQYGLGSCLDPEWSWWEHISIEPRKLAFISMKPWLTVTSLICEDLARQDPMADLVRSVGPNLVIALLMDAPQLASRWPARYATVLADDPGSSVLTLTSLGMAERSRPVHTMLRPRVVALWKDARSNTPVEIELPQEQRGIVLSLTVERVKEFSADGRDDDEASGYPVLSGVHFV